MSPGATVLRTGQAITTAGPAPYGHVRIRWTAVAGARTLAPGEPVDWAATFTGDGWDAALVVQGARHVWRPYLTRARANVVQDALSDASCPDGTAVTVDAAGVIKIYGTGGETIRLTPDS